MAKAGVDETRLGAVDALEHEGQGAWQREIDDGVRIGTSGDDIDGVRGGAALRVLLRIGSTLTVAAGPFALAAATAAAVAAVPPTVAVFSPAAPSAAEDDDARAHSRRGCCIGRGRRRHRSSLGGGRCGARSAADATPAKVECRSRAGKGTGICEESTRLRRTGPPSA